MDWNKILKVRTKDPKTGKWVNRERESELDRQSGFGGGGGGPNRGGGGAPSSDDDEEEEYSQRGGMSKDIISRVSPSFTMAEDGQVNPDDDPCCEGAKELLLEEVIEYMNENENLYKLTPARRKKVFRTIMDYDCKTINNLMEPDRGEDITLFGIDIMNLDGMKYVQEQWQLCKTTYMKNNEDLTIDEEEGARMEGKLAPSEMKPSERYREKHRDWKDEQVSPKRKRPRWKKQLRDLDGVRRR